MDIDKIKWMVGYAEGFSLNGDQLIFPEGGVETLTEELLKLRVWKLVWEPLLNQRAIEGINRAEIFQIYQADYGLSVYKAIRESKYDHELYEFKKYDSIDQTKTAALDYVYEQEKINENKK